MAYAILIVITGVALLLSISSKKSFLYFFFLLYPLLPEYLAFNISDSLPLITGSRILLMFATIACLLWNRGRIPLNRMKMVGVLKPLLLLIIVKSVLFIVHAGSPGAMKDYFSFWLEDVVFFIVVSGLITHKKEWEQCIKAMMVGASITFFFGIFETLTRVNVATLFLNTGTRSDLLMSEYERYNSLRCTFTFGHAICLGVYCVCILPLAINRLIVAKNSYMPYLITLLCLGCLLMTISRAPILIAMVMLILYTRSLPRKERKKIFTLLMSLALVAGIIILVIPQVRNTLINSIKATLNTLGAKFFLEGSNRNTNAIASRIDQFTVIPQVVQRGFFFGLGAQNYDKMNLTITTATGSYKAVSLDNQYLSWFVSYGLVGFVGNLSWFTTLAVVLRKKIKKYSVDHGQINALYFSMIGCMVCYLSVNQLTTNRVFNSVIVLICSGLYVMTHQKNVGLQSVRIWSE